MQQQNTKDLFSNEKQNNQLVEKRQERLQSSTYSSDDEDFYDAVDGLSSFNNDSSEIKGTSETTESSTLVRISSNKDAKSSKTPVEDAFNDDSLYDNVIDEEEECNFFLSYSI